MLTSGVIPRSLTAKKTISNVSSMVTKGLSMSKCAIKFAVACSDPFSPAARSACIPIGSTSTQKVSAFNRFNLQLGTTGAGRILICPCTANDLPSVFCTNNSYTGSSQMPYSGGGSVGSTGNTNAPLNPGWQEINHNGPYDSSNIVASSNSAVATANQVQGRIVSVGVRVTYVGTTLNQSGLFYCYSDPNHNSMSGMSFGELASFANTHIRAVDREPCVLVIHPTDSDEMDFPDPEPLTPANYDVNSGTRQLYPYSRGQYIWKTAYDNSTEYTASKRGIFGAGYAYGVGVPVGAIYITGVPDQSCYVEVIYHLEYTGRTPSLVATPVEADPQGARQVIAAASLVPEIKQSTAKASPWQSMFSALKTVAVKAAPVVIPMAEKALMTMLA